jgi:hypothetical protein
MAAKRKKSPPRKKRLDFRSKRTRLPDSAFAIVRGRGGPPRDLIDPKTWRSITALPDDVSLSTSGHYGTTLKVAWSIWGEWTEVVGALPENDPEFRTPPIVEAALTVSDEFQASVYNSLTGFYQIAIGALRSVVEQITVGAYLELSRNPTAVARWRSKTESFGFGVAADRISRIPTVLGLEQSLMQKVGDNLFRQKNGENPGGLIRRVFEILNRYVHTQPHYTDGDMRQSNGPIFVPQAFGNWFYEYLLVYAYAVLAVRLACPQIHALGYGSKSTIRKIFEEAVDLLRDRDDGKKLLSAIPPAFWQTASV